MNQKNNVRQTPSDQVKQNRNLSLNFPPQTRTVSVQTSTSSKDNGRSRRDKEAKMQNARGKPPLSSVHSMLVRRSSTGYMPPIGYRLSPRYRHLEKLHLNHTMVGLNGIAQQGLPSGALFRGSLPSTPICTPYYKDSYAPFNQALLIERLSQSPLPRKNWQQHLQTPQVTNTTHNSKPKTDIASLTYDMQCIGLNDIGPSYQANPLNNQLAFEYRSVQASAANSRNSSRKNSLTRKHR